MRRILFLILCNAALVPGCIAQSKKFSPPGLSLKNFLKDTTAPSAFVIPDFHSPLFPQNAAACNLPFFCRQELHFEQRTGLPLRIRLGSIAATDWLESKPGAVLPR